MLEESYEKTRRDDTRSTYALEGRVSLADLRRLLEMWESRAAPPSRSRSSRYL
jgi:hypothetical protein